MQIFVHRKRKQRLTKRSTEQPPRVPVTEARGSSVAGFAASARCRAAAGDFDRSHRMKASGNTAVLDLADVASWLAVAASVVNSTVPRQLSERLRIWDPDEMFEDTLSYLIDAGAEAGHLRDLTAWEDAFETGFRAKYQSIRAFHACRSTSTDGYRRHGIRSLSPELAEQLAIDAFSDQASREQILEALASKPISGHERWVYCFTDIVNAKHSSQNHYVQCGSEYLQALAICLGLHCRGILASRGQGYLIEVHAPIPNVVGMFRRELWRLMITEHFKLMAGGKQRKGAPDFCIAVQNGIPFECIRRFIPVADDDLDYRLPRH